MTRLSKSIRAIPKKTLRCACCVDLTILDPVIYSGKYHSLGKVLGNIGDYL